MPHPSPRADGVSAVRIAMPVGDLCADLAANPYRFLSLGRADEPCVAWRAFDSRTVHVGVGAVRVARAAGRDALRACAERVRATAVRTTNASGAPARGRPRWFGGFAFDPARAGGRAWAAFAEPVWFVLPAAQLAVGPRTAVLTVCGERAHRAGVVAAAVGLAGRLREGSWEGFREGESVEGVGAGVERTRGTEGTSEGGADEGLHGRILGGMAAIAAGEVDKVVVATSRRVNGAGWEVGRLLARIGADAPGCTVFLVSPQAGAAWLGATPERLVRVRGRRLWTMALAGTARRGDGARADRAIGAALLASDKDRREHRAVVDAIVGELTTLEGAALEAAPAPRLRRLATMQHLETPITARSTSRLDVLDIARRLHPTPALAGWPRAAALDLIARLEPEGRGWYGGGVGWLDGTGDGDIAVGIRGLLLREGAATAHAGAGLVAGSDAAAEAREIELKLAAAFAPLQGWATSSAGTSAGAPAGDGVR